MVASNSINRLKNDSSDTSILYLPLEQLADLCMSRLKTTLTLERASRSLLYRKKWEDAGINVDEIDSYSDLVKIPYTTGEEVKAAINLGPIDDVLCSKKVVQWFSTTGMSSTPKWIPYTSKDIEALFLARDRGYKIAPPIEKLRCMAVSSPAPFIENALSAYERIQSATRHWQKEGVDICLTEWENKDAFDFCMGLKPNILACWPAFAALFAEIIEEKAQVVTRENLFKHKSIGNLLAFLVTLVMKIKPKNLSDYKWGLFGGEPLEPYRHTLEDSFGLEPYEMYMLTEFICGAVECHIHDGMHLWLDNCVAEIIPESELKKEGSSSNYTPKTVPLWSAKSGLKGEYVFTTFGDALPLIRYRSRDLIKVVSNEKCKCGITHPRIKVLRRTDGTICLGAFRFPVEHLEARLLAETVYGKAQRWQLEISRKGFHLLPIIRLEPKSEIINKANYLSQINANIMELKTLRTGIENKILLEPILLITDKIPDVGEPVTASGRVIYED